MAINSGSAMGDGAPLAVDASSFALDLSGKRSRALSERVVGAVLWACGALSLLTTVGIILILLQQAFVFFSQVPLTDFMFGTTWTALFRTPLYGVLPLVGGTLMITVVAMAVAIPLGLMSAIYLSEYAATRVRDVLKPALEILAGIPTIVYGFFAVTFIRPELLKPIFPGIGPFSALAAGIAVGFMTIPLVASLSEDAMRAACADHRAVGNPAGELLQFRLPCRQHKGAPRGDSARRRLEHERLEVTPPEARMDDVGL